MITLQTNRESSTMSFMHSMEKRMKHMMNQPASERIQRAPTPRLQPQEEKKLIVQAAKNHASGMSWCEAAAGTGLSGDSVRRKALRLGLAKPSFSCADRAVERIKNDSLALKVDALRAEGKSLAYALKGLDMKEFSYHRAIDRRNAL